MRHCSLLVAALWLGGPNAAAGADPVEATSPWRDRVTGALLAFAIGDAMAAEIEKWSPAQIAAQYGTGDFEKFIPAVGARGLDGVGKGGGRISDDTLEVEALMRAYARHGDHIDAYGYVSAFLPELVETKVWVAEKQDFRAVVDRPMWWPERFAHMRNAIVHADPRRAGQGNWLNQGLAVFIWPVGAVNAGEPARAYAEAVAFGSAHTESYALEAAAVLAAAYAEAFGPSPTVERVLATALQQAKDGTRLALVAVLESVDPEDAPLQFAAKARRAWLPFSGLSQASWAAAADKPVEPDAGNQVGRPSRIQSVETIPAALAVLKWSRGDFRRALRAGVLYGFDAESIAAIATSLVAAMHGRNVVPAGLISAVQTENRRDFAAQSEAFVATVTRIGRRDAVRLAAREAAVFDVSAAGPSKSWVDRITATLYAFAIADGMGGPIEKWTPATIVSKFGDGDFTKFIASTDSKAPPDTGKGDGRITDDVLGIEALMRAYATQGGHLDAYDYPEFFVPEIAKREIWVPERQDVRPALLRPLPQPERYAHHRNAISMVEPRQAGQGNWLNEGFNSIVWPIGAVNAGDPTSAYAETIAFGSAHTESYGLEAGAVTAACFAEALGPRPTVESILAVAMADAKDGTRLAVEAVLASVDPDDSPGVFADKARRAWLPFSGLSPGRMIVAEPDTLNRSGTNVGRPSRTQSIENLPAALAAFKWSRGDYRRALRAGLIYGRDAESIAAASSGLAAAMHGRAVLPADLCVASELANRRDFGAEARAFCEVVVGILKADVAAAASRRAAVLGEK